MVCQPGSCRGANFKGSLRRQWNNRKCGAGKVRLPHAKEFLRKISKIWARDLKTFASPALDRKSLKSMVEEVQNYLPARGAYMSRAGPAY